ncbi:MAG: methyltransferase domain-containing protein [Myxococcales bacterium]|nr:methyltransferase domain-containing protein [Myxococcales bacterium]
MQAQSTYSLQVGEPGAERLRLVQETYGPASRALLASVGLGPGRRVVELGCGVGTMCHWMAERVGSGGCVVGVDASADQLAVARAGRGGGPSHPVFVEASAHDTGLPGEHFDLAYARLLLMHVARPPDVLAEMRRVLAPGGVLVCEEISIDSSFCEPPSPAQARLRALALALAERRGCDYNVARGLYRAVRAAGFTKVELGAHQPIFVRGEGKRIEALSFAELGDRIVREGLASREEVARLCGEVHALAADESVVYGQSRMIQVWAER